MFGIDLASLSSDELDALHTGILDVQRARLISEEKLAYDQFYPFYGRSGDYFHYVHDVRMCGIGVYVDVLTLHIESKYDKDLVYVKTDCVPLTHVALYTRIEKAEFDEMFEDVMNRLKGVV